jgi:glutathione S-transferase
MTMTLYDFPRSGHAHRIRLFLSIIGEIYETVLIDMLKGEHKDPEYRKLSPLGQVPTFVDGDTIITDSTAALVYLAIKHGDERWLPRDAEGAARVQRWLSAASGEVYRGPVLARAGRRFGRPVDLERAEAESKRLFKWMQQELADRTWLAADHATIADIAIYSYIRVSDEGELDLAPYPAILRWLEDVEKLDGFEAMPRGDGVQFPYK